MDISATILPFSPSHSTGIFLAMMWPPFCKIRSTIAPNTILQKISQGGAEIWIGGAYTWISLVVLKRGQVELNGRLVGLEGWNIHRLARRLEIHYTPKHGSWLDMAEIYGYTTKAFNQQVKNNIQKFDDDFRFQLTKDEWENLRSKILTSSWGRWS